MSITIRPAAVGDLEPLATLKGGDDDARRARTRYRLEEMRHRRAVYLVAVTDTIIGHVFLKYGGKASQPDYPDIEDLYVHPDYRQIGVGMRLIDECERMARENGFTQIGLAVTVDPDSLARRLYDKLGYTLTEAAPYVDGIYDGVEDWVIDMVKEI